MSAALVRAQRVVFRGGPGYMATTARIVEPLPLDTLDPRYTLCWDHHTACLCREAELAEDIGELAHELRAVRDAAVDVLAGHRLFDYTQHDDVPDRAERLRLIRGDGPLACQCSGCRLMRLADIGGMLFRADHDGVVRAVRR